MCVWCYSESRPLWVDLLRSFPTRRFSLSLGSRPPRCHGLEGRRRGSACPPNRQRPFIYHRSKFFRTCVDQVDAGAASLPVCYRTETARRWVASALPPCGREDGRTPEIERRTTHGRLPEIDGRTAHGVRALRGTYPSRIGYSRRRRSVRPPFHGRPADRGRVVRRLRHRLRNLGLRICCRRRPSRCVPSRCRLRGCSRRRCVRPPFRGRSAGRGRAACPILSVVPAVSVCGCLRLLFQRELA